MIDGVIFDMDGLMFDTEKMWATFWEPELTRRGLATPPNLAAETCGVAESLLLDIIRGYFGAQLDAEEFVNAMRKSAYEAFFAAPVPKKEGLDALLAYLKENHIPMAIASSSPAALVENNLAKHGLLEDFPVRMTGDKIARSKPAPDIFLAAAEAIGIAPERCLVLEDSHNGVRAGAAGGFITVMIPDFVPPNAEMRAISTAIYPSLTHVLEALQDGSL